MHGFTRIDSNSDREEEEASPEKNVYKVRAFDNAIKVLNKLDHPLQSANEAMTVGHPLQYNVIVQINVALQLKAIGRGITRRINEFLAENENLSVRVYLFTPR
jgi:DNA polymerase beta